MKTFQEFLSEAKKSKEKADKKYLKALEKLTKKRRKAAAEIDKQVRQREKEIKQRLTEPEILKKSQEHISSIRQERESGSQVDRYPDSEPGSNERLAIIGAMNHLGREDRKAMRKRMKQPQG